MDNKELLKKADEFLEMAFLGDGKEQSLVYEMKARLEELIEENSELQETANYMVFRTLRLSKVVAKD